MTLYRALPNQSFDAHLFGEDNREIPKTEEGKRFGKPLEPDLSLLDGSWKTDLATEYGDSRIFDFSKGFGSTHQWDFAIERSFQIKVNGTYNLKVQVRTFIMDSNHIYRPFLLPAVEISVKINDKADS